MTAPAPSPSRDAPRDPSRSAARRPQPDPVTPERLERALALVAYLVARDMTGRVYVPIMDRLEMELVRVRAAEDPVFRARRLLGAYTIKCDAPVLR